MKPHIVIGKLTDGSVIVFETSANDDQHAELLFAEYCAESRNDIVTPAFVGEVKPGERVVTCSKIKT